MSKIFLFALLACFATTAFGQNQTGNGHRISLHLGSATPTASFRSTSFEDDYPPFAENGSIVTINYVHDVQPYLALGATAGWRRNPFNLDAFVAADDELVSSKEAKPWHSVLALADIYLQTQMQQVTLYTKGSVGAALNRSAALHISTAYGDILRTKSNSTSIAFGFGGGLRYDFSRFGVVLDVNYLATKPLVEFRDAQGNVITYKQAMNSLNFSLGLAYSL